MGCVTYGESIDIKHDVGVFFVERRAFYEEIVQAARTILHDNAAFMQAAQAILQLIVRNSQVDYRAEGGKMGHGAIGIDCRTARGNNASLRFKGAQNLVLNRDEPLRTKSVDDLLPGLIALVLDEQVGIYDVVGHDLREHDTKR